MAKEFERKEKLERMEKKLYSRNAPDIIDGSRTEMTKKEDQFGRPNAYNSSQNIQSVGPAPLSNRNNFDEIAAKMSRVAENKNSFLKKILIFSVVLFVLALGIAAYVFYGGMNLVSTKNVDIQVEGPVTVGGGQEVSYDIKIINNNNADLQSAALLIEYPEGTRTASDLSKDLLRDRFTIDTIKSGQTFTQNVKAVFFGEKDSVKQMHFSLEYRIQNSSALFYKEKFQDISISSAPVILTATYPKEANSGQTISFNVEAASNSKDKINDLLVSAEYPFGFVFNSATPAPTYGNNVWKFSSLNPSEKKTIRISGSLIGQDGEEKVFRVSTGNQSSEDERVIAVPLGNITESVLVKKPFVTLDVSLNGRDGDITADGGRQVNADITMHNNLPGRLFNSSVTVTLSGGAFDKLSVRPQGNGFFQSSNNTILWDSRSDSTLSDVAPGDEKHFNFQLAPLQYSQIAGNTRPEIILSIVAAGDRVLDSGSSEHIESKETRKIVLNTNLNVSAKVTRSEGSIENSGPIPPKVNNPTTYTIIWNISNSFNQVSNAEIRATLPSYVKWTNLYSPSTEIISYDSVSNQVIWKAGSILPNTGFGSSNKQVMFQIEFLPSTSQIGQSPFLVGEAQLSGTDKITGMRVSARAPAVSTFFSSDPNFHVGDEKVIP